MIRDRAALIRRNALVCKPVIDGGAKEGKGGAGSLLLTSR